VQQKWALVIGIGRFTDKSIPRLNYTTADATAIAAQLKIRASASFPRPMFTCSPTSRRLRRTSGRAELDPRAMLSRTIWC